MVDCENYRSFLDRVIICEYENMGKCKVRNNMSYFYHRNPHLEVDIHYRKRLVVGVGLLFCTEYSVQCSTIDAFRTGSPEKANAKILMGAE